MTNKKSRLFLTGDLHGQIDISKLNSTLFPEQKNLTKDDYLIVLGDFGLIWCAEGSKNKKEEDYWVDWLNTRNYTTIVVLGNHENYDRIEKLPEVDMFGGKVLKYTDSIYVLKRGAIYDILGKTFFTMGGAQSIDKNIRTPKLTWWEQEIPSHAEFDAGLDALEGHNNKVDYVITHTPPKRVIVQYMNYCRNQYIEEFKGQYDEGELPKEFHNRITNTFIDVDYFNAKQDSVSEYLDVIAYDNKLNFKRWFFGHLHDEWVNKTEEYTMLYRKIIELDVDNDTYK